MRICFIADYRSPIARNWIGHFLAAGHEVHIISSYPTAREPRAASFRAVSLGFSGLQTNARLRRHFAASEARATSGGENSAGSSLVTRGRRALRIAARLGGELAREAIHWTSTLELRRHLAAVRETIDDVRPDLVHAMRIPYEGLLATEALRDRPLPLVLSVWGNDFTYFARRYPPVRAAIRSALARADGLHSDCARDQRLAREHGFNAARAHIVLPGSGGVQRETFAPAEPAAALRAHWDLPAGRPMVFNPRNFRPGCVQNDAFFAAMEHVQRDRPDVIVCCIGMAGNPVAEAWRRRMPHPEFVRLLPSVTRTEMADLFRLADVSVSPSIIDGTPNTLLEAMACGAFPVAGDIESIREWVVDGENGLLCDPTNPEALAAQIRRAIDDERLRARARLRNQAIIDARAEYGLVMTRAESFYESVARRGVAARAAAGDSRR